MADTDRRETTVSMKSYRTVKAIFEKATFSLTMIADPDSDGTMYQTATEWI